MLKMLPPLNLTLMDYCDEDQIDKIWSEIKTEGLDDVKVIFKNWTPVSLILCLVSILLSFHLLTSTHFNGLPHVNSMSQNYDSYNHLIMTRSSSLLINLMITNSGASFVCGLGIGFVKFLPIHFDIVVGDCFLLVLEIFQISSLIASGLHHLLLSFNQYSILENLRSVQDCRNC